MNPIIKFDQNWNKKLDCNIFTTIRKYDQYYLDAEGWSFDVELNKEIYCQAKLISIKCTFFEVIPLEFLRLDTGLEDITDIYKIFKKFGVLHGDDIIILTFKRI